jgi:bifunctional non-homologous end joining protein LigD
MPKPPRRSRSISRSANTPADIAANAPISVKGDARQADLFVPAFVPPCKPTLSDRVPMGERWQYEIKHDGYRTQAHLHEGTVRLYTKSGLDWTERMPLIARAVASLTARSAVIDGEAVMLDQQAISNFFALHAALAAKRAPHAFLVAFDLLWLDGEDVRQRPLAERRAMLAETLVGAPDGLELSEHLVGDGSAILRAACDMGLEGIVAKRRDCPYRSGRSETWLKVKCTTTEPFAVIGFDAVGSGGVRSLRVARLSDGELTPAGWVGSGLTEAAARELRRILDAGEHVVVDVEYRGFSPAGELRHPVFKRYHVEE